MRSANEVAMNTGFQKKYIVFAALSLLVGLILLVMVAGTLISLDREAPLSKDAQDTMYRCAVLTNNEASLANWKTEVEQGHVSVSDYVRVLFTGHDYLLSGKDDGSFAADLACVAFNDAFNTEEIAGLLDGGSRKYTIEKVLSDVDPSYAPLGGFSDQKGTVCTSVEMMSPLQNEEGYAFGIRQIDGQMRVDGNELRADFFVDGMPRTGEIYVPPISGLVQFTMEWDTHGEIPGKHDVIVLLRTSDGRGQVVTGGSVNIPKCLPIANDVVEPSCIEMSTNESWYVLDAEDRNAYVNIVGLSGDVAVTLYDRFGNLIGENDLHHTDVEVLRGRSQSLDSGAITTVPNTNLKNEFYVRVRRSPVSTPSLAEISYVLVMSKEVAIGPEGEYLAVLNEVGAVPTPRPTGAVPDGTDEEQVTCRTMEDTDVTFMRKELKFMPLNGYLTELSFTGASGEALEIYPDFSSDTFDYSIVGKDFGELQVAYTALEGYSADVSISNKINLFPTDQHAVNGSISTDSGKNEITVEVTTLDGQKRDYTLHLLDGTDEEGFANSTLASFPQSYADGLWLLHCLHPEYRFEAYNVGISFEEVLNNEDKGSRSLIQETYNPAWVKPDSPVYDGKSWKAAKREVVSYFLDPRNFLTPTGIFQFEKLSFDPSIHTLDGISAMTKNSFLAADDPDYRSILLEAGELAQVSPYFLASRILQEMGRDGQSKLASGTLQGYEGYYNFYNIGSTPDPSVQDGALINGAKYAMYGSEPDKKQITPDEEELLLPWTSPEKAICGGAIWIARKYIEIGQNTLYFQKFDIIQNEDGLYNHQYAQNIAMASNEGIRYYTAYASQDMLDSSFIFIIPVYEEMPNDYGQLP